LADFEEGLEREESSQESIEDLEMMQADVILGSHSELSDS
jgi:hypothetical protein